MVINNKQFISQLTGLKKLVQFYTTENKVATLDTNEGIPENYELLIKLTSQLKDFNVLKRTFNYNSLIISLYGYFEKFIEDIIELYVDDLNTSISDYNQLPEPLIKNHLSLSIQMINKVESNKYQGQLSKETIINNLHACINTRTRYILNKEAFRQHSSNFRHLTITEVFGKLGLPNISDLILDNKNFYSYTIVRLQKTEGEKLTADEAFDYIDELAERRNDVAHGVSGEILNLEILSDFITYFEFYSAAITEVVNRNLQTIKLLRNSINLGELTGWYKNGMVICFYTKNNPIEIGDYVWGLNENGYVKCRILSIKYKDKFVDRVDKNDSYDIGVELDVPLKKSHKIHLLPEDNIKIEKSLNQVVLYSLKKSGRRLISTNIVNGKYYLSKIKTNHSRAKTFYKLPLSKVFKLKGKAIKPIVNSKQLRFKKTKIKRKTNYAHRQILLARHQY